MKAQALIASLGVMTLISSIYIMDQDVSVNENNTVYQKFIEWGHKYNKHYLSDSEFYYRLEIYRNNLETIVLDNLVAQGTVEFGENEYSDLDYSEFKALKMAGHNHESHNHKVQKGLLGASHKTNSKVRYLDLQDLPANVDWREQAVTKVQNQGNCGGCWAFSTVGALEGAHAVKTDKLKSFSVQQVLDCCRMNLFGCNGGDPIVAFEECVIRDGVMHEHEYPFQGDQSSSCLYDGSRLAFQPRDYHIVPPNDSEQLKMAVSKQPISVCISSGQAFHFYKAGILDNEQCGNDTDHCVLAVGYGTDAKGKDFWLVKNSWGTGWGENGFVRILRTSKQGPSMCGIASEGSYVVY